MKTSTIILIAAGAALALYLLTQKSSTVVHSNTATGLGGTLTGIGAAATGVATLWDSVSSSGSDSAEVAS